MEHVFYILIVILFVVLMNNYAIEGVANLEYVNKMTSEKSIKYCNKLVALRKTSNPNCLNKFYYNTDTNKIEACFGWLYERNKYDYGVSCYSPREENSTIREFIDKNLICEGNYKSCPTCDDNSYYSLESGDKCSLDFKTCNSCLTNDTISWNNPESYEREYNINGVENEENISYTGYNPLKDCNDTTKFCETLQNDCFSDIRAAISDIREDSSKTCSNESILEKIEENNIMSKKCKYDKVQIYAEDEWLKDFLETDRYCDPTADDTWKCQRDLPKYCITKDDCEYDMNAHKCICRPPLEMLQNDTCGIPDCGPINDGFCKAGQICQRFNVPGPAGGGTVTYSCVDKTPKPPNS